MGIGTLMGNLFHGAERQAAEKASKAAAADLEARIAAKDAAQNIKVDLLRQSLHVDADSPLPKIFDTFERSKELVYPNGASYMDTYRNEAAKALLEKEIYGEKRWEIYPESTYEKLTANFSSEKVQSLFHTHAAEEGQFSAEDVKSLIAPMSPEQVKSAFWRNEGVVIHDRVAHERLPASSVSELFQAAKSFLGKQ